MTISLRWLARSWGLRTLAGLAWLMLVSTSLAAGPMQMDMHGGGSSVAHVEAATSVVHNHGSAFSTHLASSMPGHACCGDPVTQGCDCHFVCAGVVHSVAVVVRAPVFFASVYDLPSRIRAPSPNTAVPLRPPSV